VRGFLLDRELGRGRERADARGCVRWEVCWEEAGSLDVLRLSFSAFLHSASAARAPSSFFLPIPAMDSDQHRAHVYRGTC
jgi:hypothetical protein